MNWNQLISNKRLGQEYRHADRHGLPVQERVAASLLDGVSEAVPQVQKPALAQVGLVRFDDLRLHA